MRIVIALLFPALLYAQKYDLSAGLRLGTELGLSVQYRLDKKSTLEGILHSSFREGLNIATLLYEDHHGLIVRRLNVYSGLGPHFGWYDSRTESTPRNPFGITAIAGLELTLGRLNLSWDFKPMVHLLGGSRKFSAETALTLRHVFIRRKNPIRLNLPPIRI